MGDTLTRRRLSSPTPRFAGLEIAPPHPDAEPDEITFDVATEEDGVQETTRIVVTRTGHAYWMDGPIRRRVKGYLNLARAYGSALQVLHAKRLEAAGLSQEKCGCVSKSGVVVRPCEQHRGGGVRS